MERIVTVEEARRIMGRHFIGPEELETCSQLPVQMNDAVPDIPYSASELEARKDDYFLILGLSTMEGGKPLTIRHMLDVFGKDPAKGEPCFYNQDWYLKEDFIDVQLPEGWFLIRKQVFEDSRSKLPDELEKKHSFPLAVRCVYAFFAAWLCQDEKLWWHDFVWCCDRDHNGDRIYVGKYHDIDGVNKNGFSIHRHLALRPCYGAID